MTVTSPDRLFDAVVADATSSVIDTNTHSGIKVFRVAPSSSFAGTLTVQGQQNGDGDTWQRVRYWTNRPPSTDVEGPSSDVLIPVPSDYLLLFVVDPWPAMRLVATRTAGSLTVDFFNELNRDFAALLLGSSSSMSIADADTGDTLVITPSGGIAIVSGDPNDAHVTSHLWSVDGPVGVQNPLPVQGQIEAVLAASESHVGEVSGHMGGSVVEFTRPANTTAYTAQDVVGPAVTQALLLPNVARVAGGAAYITGVKLTTNNASFLGTIRVYFHQDMPAAIADNAPFTLLWAERQGRWYVDLPAMTTGGSGADATETENIADRLPVMCRSGSTSLYATLVITTVSGAPTSGQIFRLAVITEQY